MAEGDQFFLASSTSDERFELTGDTSVGRSAESDLVVSEGQPSRHHAKITIEGSAVYVEDLNSTNGTFVNGRQLREKQQLKNGDEIAFDVNKFTLDVQLARPSDADATVFRQVLDPAQTVMRPVLKEEPVDVEPPAAEPVAPPRVEQPEPSTAEVTPTAEPAAEPKPPGPDVPVEPTPPPPEPAAAPAPVVAKAKSVKPGSWADPDDKNASSTQFFSPDDLAKMRGGAGAVGEKVESDVPYLQVTTGSAAGSLIQLVVEGAKTEWTMGSDPGRDIIFTDQGVSEFHTILVHEAGRWKLVDQMSTNGTYINDSKTISGFLNSGDTIRIGTVKCSFVLPGGAAGARTGASAAKGGAGNKIWASVASFVVVLAVLFGVYFFLM